MRALLFVSSLASICLIGGCNHLSKAVGSENISGASDAISMNSNQRGVYFLAAKKGDQPKVLVEPPPDTALNSILIANGKVGLNATTQAGDASGSLDYRQTTFVIQRHMKVLVLRDLMFRNAEAFVNGAITPDQFATLQEKVITLATTFIQQDWSEEQKDAKNAESAGTQSAANEGTVK